MKTTTEPLRLPKPLLNRNKGVLTIRNNLAIRTWTIGKYTLKSLREIGRFSTTEPLLKGDT